MHKLRAVGTTNLKLFIHSKLYILLNNSNSASAQEDTEATVLNDLIIDAIQDVKGKGIKKYDLRQLDEASTDFFIICHGSSGAQLGGILSNIEKKVIQQLGIRPNHTEGKMSKNWRLIDYFSVVVHVFAEDKRGFYNLDDLWSDAIVTAYEDI